MQHLLVKAVHSLPLPESVVFLSLFVLELAVTMLGDHSCSACLASMQSEDGHDMCPQCLGLKHLRDGLSEDPCMNCCLMPRAVRVARLAEAEHLLGHVPKPNYLTPAQKLTAGAPSGKRAKESKLASRVDQLTEELNQVKSLFLAIQSGTGAGDVGAPAPPAAMFDTEEDVLSMAASATEFADYGAGVAPQDVASHTSWASSHSTTHSCGTGSEDSSM